MKKIFLLLSVAMGLSYNANAKDVNCDGWDCDCDPFGCTFYDNSCGTNCSWELDDNGTLKIWATDSTKAAYMNDYGFDYSLSYNGYDVWVSAPWGRKLSEITAVEVSGISNIGDSAFDGYSGIKTITLDESVKRIGAAAFYGTGLEGIDWPYVEEIGSDAFAETSQLKYVHLNENVKFDWIETTFYRSPLEDCIWTEGNRTCGSCGDKYIKSGTGCVAECGEEYTANSGTMQCVNNATPETPSVADEIEEAENDEEAIISACYNSGKVYYKGECLNEYPFARKHWTPAEAAKYLKDDDNEIIITFKK